MQTDIQELSALVGASVIAVERCAMGFENRTDLVTLADGQRRIVQRITSRALAPHKIRLAQQLPERLAAVGVRLPRVLAADPHAEPPYLVREYLHGAPANTLLADDASATTLARAMGALLPRLAQVDTAGLGLHRGWADGERLARQSRQHLDRCRPLLDAATLRKLEQTIAAVPELFAGRGGCFAHGDFCPVNALVSAEQRTTSKEHNVKLRKEGFTPSAISLIDVEFARVADPLFDAAWWGWVVRYHHPERWRVACPVLLKAAGIKHDDLTIERVQALQRLRCLETLSYYLVTRGADGAAMWMQRLTTTVAWEL
ncbi:MAG TPA: phosphotransferase [Roseiflexaceae bacterium]|jgi:aminoglycoside phosphotransferase (APT) family kinase protein|nr:phosphotransferase [Roseiflexaceae bacterium]